MAAMTLDIEKQKGDILNVIILLLLLYILACRLVLLECHFSVRRFFVCMANHLTKFHHKGETEI